MPKKSLGQNFLTDRAVAQRIIRAIAPERGDFIVEIGAGHGELTLPLARACGERGCRIVALEKDRRLAEHLSEKVRAADETVLRVECGDALSFFPDGLRAAAGEAGSEKIKIVGNIPYYLTGRLLRLIGETNPKPARCVFMLQKEVADRLAARPPRMNRLAANVQFWGAPEVVFAVPKTLFRPPPKVDSAIVAIEAKDRRGAESGDAEDYHTAARLLFSQPRKTILNNLAAPTSRLGGGEHKAGDKGGIAEMLRGIGINPEARPQNLSSDDIGRIAAALRKWG